MHADLVLMLLADARLPVAGHTQSGSLESALRHGLAPDAVPAYLETRLATVTAVEAGTGVVAQHLVGVDGTQDLLIELDHAWEARTPSPALRDAARRQGRALQRLAVRVWPESKELARVADVSNPSRAVVLGAVASHLGLPGPALARLVGYDDVQTVCAAALKLLPLDPAVVAGWLVAAAPAIEALAERVGHLVDSASVPATGNPLIESWAQAHVTTPRRLFHA